MTAHYELTTQPRFGPGDGDAKEAVILNRIIRWTEHGIEYAADPRQCEKLVAKCGMANADRCCHTWPGDVVRPAGER